MSLEEKTILESTVTDLAKEAWDTAILTHDLWKAVAHEKRNPDKKLIPEIKKRLAKLKALADELPQ